MDEYTPPGDVDWNTRYLFDGDTPTAPETCPVCGYEGIPVVFALHPPEMPSDRPFIHRCGRLECDATWVPEPLPDDD